MDFQFPYKGCAFLGRGKRQQPFEDRMIFFGLVKFGKITGGRRVEVGNFSPKGKLNNGFKCVKC
jgi:hypothetical protein